MTQSVVKNKPITPSYVRDSISRYQKNSVKRVGIVFYRDTDKELIDKIEGVKNMSAYIKALIASDIEKNPVTPELKAKSKELRRYSSSEERRVSILINKTSDADLLERIDAQSNMGDYIKKLIENDLA